MHKLRTIFQLYLLSLDPEPNLNISWSWTRANKNTPFPDLAAINPVESTTGNMGCMFVKTVVVRLIVCLCCWAKCCCLMLRCIFGPPGPIYWVVQRATSSFRWINPRLFCKHPSFFSTWNRVSTTCDISLSWGELIFARKRMLE